MDEKTIVVKKSVNADSRSAPQPPTEQELTKATKSHIEDVMKGMKWFADKLVDAGLKHDNTKISNMLEFHKALTGGEIKKTDWYEEHITKERHHLKSKCPDDVTLVDVIEHIIDCTMAGLTRTGEVYDVDIDERILSKAVENTVELLKKNTKVVKESTDILDELINS